jgi:hypothetical protein
LGKPKASGAKGPLAAALGFPPSFLKTKGLSKAPTKGYGDKGAPTQKHFFKK